MRAWCLLLLLGVGCSRSPESPGSQSREQTGAVKSPTAKKAEVTPEVIRKAEEILRDNEGAAIGTEIPFDLNGQRYIARIEEHNNTTGNPQRPEGVHRGVTVYVAP